MARPLRLELAGGLYHVTSRGDRREDIYRDDADRDAWLAVFAQVCERFNWRCHAYCLMSNHYHVVLEWRPVQTLVAGVSGGFFARIGQTQVFNNFSGDLAMAAANSMVNTAYKNNFEGGSISYMKALLYSSGFAWVGRVSGYLSGCRYRQNVASWRGQANEIGSLLLGNLPVRSMIGNSINPGIQLGGAAFEPRGWLDR